MHVTYFTTWNIRRLHNIWICRLRTKAPQRKACSPFSNISITIPNHRAPPTLTRRSIRRSVIKNREFAEAFTSFRLQCWSCGSGNSCNSFLRPWIHFAGCQGRGTPALHSPNYFHGWAVFEVFNALLNTRNLLAVHCQNFVTRLKIYQPEAWCCNIGI